MASDLQPQQESCTECEDTHGIPGSEEVDRQCMTGSYHTDGSDIEVLLEPEEKDSSDSIEVLDSEKSPMESEHEPETNGTKANGSLKTLGSGPSNCSSTDPKMTTNEALEAMIMTQVGSLTKPSEMDMGRKRNDSNASDMDRSDVSNSSERDKTGDDSSTESISLHTVEGALPDLPDQRTPQDIDLSRESPLHGASNVLSSSCYATSDSDSSCYMYEPPPSSSDYEGYPFTQIDSPAVSNGNIPRPDSLSLPRPMHYYERKRLAKRESESSISEYSRSSSTDALIEAASSTPLHKQGTLTKDGDMVAFVAEGLTEMIKMSSPLTKKEPYSLAWSGSQTPSARSVSSVSSSASGWSMTNSSVSGFSYSGMSRSPSLVTQSPEDIPPIDPRVVFELELQARRVAESLEHMMTTLQHNLHKMSHITVNCLDAYKDGVDNTCDSVDAGIKSMYALMAKCEELSKTVRPVYDLHEQIKEIKRLLDLFETQMGRDDK